MKIIAVDGGKANGKAICEDRFIIFPSKIDVGENLFPTSNTYQVTLDGKTYTVGEGATSYNFDLTKANDHHKVLIYLAVANLITKTERVQLVVGMPILQYRNKDLREAYREFLMPSDERGKVEIQVNDREVVFHIDDILVMPESVGVLYNDLEEYENGLVGVVDIGGLNCNACIYDELNPIKESLFTINSGGNIIINKIKKGLNEKFGMNCQEYEIPHLIKNGTKLKEGDALISSILEEHVYSIVQEMKKNNWNIETLDIIFTGGGSLLVKDHINKFIESYTLSQNALWDNVNGFHRIGEMYYGEQE